MLLIETSILLGSIRLNNSTTGVLFPYDTTLVRSGSPFGASSVSFPTISSLNIDLSML